MRSALLRLPSLLAGALALGALAALARFRPYFRETPDSLASPVTTAFLQELVLVAAWLLAALVIVLLLVQSLRGIRARRQVNLGVTWDGTTGASSRVRRAMDKVETRHLLVAEPQLVVVGPREAPTTKPDEEVLGSLPDSPASVEPEADARPLVSVLGPLTIYGGKRSRRGLRARALEVIAFLALRREGAQRDELLEALWPGEDPGRSRQRLYQAIRDARRLLGDAVASERDRYWLDRDQVRVDVDELERLLDEARRSSGERRLELLERALALVRDEPLAGGDFLWSEGEIRRLRGAYVELLEAVGRARLDGGDGSGALEAAERAITVDSLNEEVHRLAMEAEGALGLRKAIIERYERLCGLLDERLGLQPDRATRALYLELLSQG